MKTTPAPGSLRRHATTLALLSLGIPLAALAADQLSASSASADASKSHQPYREPRPLVDRVYNANKKFANINSILGNNSDWVQATQCVSSPDFGAMGVHFIVPGRVFEDPKVNAEYPEALIYEPTGHGGWDLVGVEFIVLKDLWFAQYPKPDGPPTVEGHQMNLVSGENRYGLPAFYELHVWAFEHNPLGTFADYNTRVSCEKQPTPRVP